MHYKSTAVCPSDEQIRTCPVCFLFTLGLYAFCSPSWNHYKQHVLCRQLSRAQPDTVLNGSWRPFTFLRWSLLLPCCFLFSLSGRRISFHAAAQAAFRGLAGARSASVIRALACAEPCKSAVSRPRCSSRAPASPGQDRTPRPAACLAPPALLLLPVPSVLSGCFGSGGFLRSTPTQTSPHICFSLRASLSLTHPRSEPTLPRCTPGDGCGDSGSCIPPLL